ncbi:MAG: hypothetical protein R3E66_23275 [bacterium]
MIPQNKKLLVLAAVLASSSALDMDEKSGEISLKAQFPTHANISMDGHLLTSEAFRVEIDHVGISADSVDVRARNEMDLDHLIRQMDGRTLDVSEGVVGFVPTQTELVMNDVLVSGRIYDDTDLGRLPAEGLGISGRIPIEVQVRKGTTAKPLDVNFVIPTHFFDGIDWSV